jgi:hypothetical protein
MNIEFTAHELLERKRDFLVSLKESLEKKLNKERNLALPILRHLITEFNSKAENEYEENYVDLTKTHIPPSLKPERVIEFIKEEFENKGFQVKPNMVAGRTYIRISWEHQQEIEEIDNKMTLELMIREIVKDEIKNSLKK